MFPKPFVLPSAKPTQEVFATVLQVVQEGGYTLQALTNEGMEMIFTSDRTALSYGHTYVVGVVPAEQGAVVQLTVDGIPGKPGALLDGRKNKKAGERLLDQLRAALESGAAPRPQPVGSFAVLADGTVVPWAGGDYPGA